MHALKTKQLITKLRSKEYYIRLINILEINGLLEIFEEELKDGKIDYLQLTLNLLSFLQKNKKYFKNFSFNKLENIIILCIDEILTKKFQIEIDEEQLNMILNLVKNSFLFKSLLTFVRDIFIKIYYNWKCKSCYKTKDVVIEFDKSRHN
tara:strand:- start:51 stop:500 length:450 start_codon:yes stop_codon:yes gene_type:complete